MMFQGDLIIKTAIELALEDMRQQPWLIEDCFSCLLRNPYLKERYGMKEVARAKEWIINNKINVYLRERVDKQEFPCVTLSVSSGQEDKSLATLGDTDIITESYDPSDIDKKIPFIVKPFNLVSYDKATGEAIVPDDTEGIQYVGPGMVLINSETGEGWPIIKVTGTTFGIAPGSDLSGKVAVIPQFCFYEARRESIESKYSFNIGCHAHGDPSELIFLFDVIKYGLLRYRESLLEANGFQLSNLSFTDLIKNKAFGEENVYSRWITIEGQVNESWVKGTHRVIEAIALEDEDGNTGIKVAAGAAPDFLDEECEPWLSIPEETEE